MIHVASVAVLSPYQISQWLDTYDPLFKQPRILNSR
jgi:hypothetical protein